jgi:hypothetical protein
MGGNKSFQLTASLSSSQDNVSPVLDVDSLGVIGVQNRINNIDTIADVSQATDTNFVSDSNHVETAFIPSTEARGDTNASVYISKKITLTNPANALHIMFDGYRGFDSTGSESEIQIYYKVQGPDFNLPFEDLGWKQATIKNTVPADASDFKEYLYEIESLEDFNTFSIKIVLQSDNSANVPFVENFRAIALST